MLSPRESGSQIYRSLITFMTALIVLAGFHAKAEARHQFEHAVIVAQHFPFDGGQPFGTRAPPSAQP